MAQPIWNATTKSYLYQEKTNPKDRVDVEVGDAEDSSTFHPQVKIKRWDNEVNASIRLIHTQIPGNVSWSDDGTKITWIKKQGQNEWKAIFYHRDDLDEGGFEFEIHLPAKPPQNYLEFSVNIKDLDWFYQPPLTQQDIDEGASRPENVVGSYAVYHKYKGGMNDAAGMEYKAGKAFHVYRPHVVDNNGNETWGTLELDEVNGILRISVDQNWLNNAVYPVVVDPTFGYNVHGASGGQFSADYVYGSTFTPSIDGAVTSITIDHRNNSGTDHVKGILVDHSSLNILTNGVGNAVSSGSGVYEWLVSSMSSSPSISDGSSYIIGMIADAAGDGDSYYYDAGSADQGHVDSSNSYTTPANLGSITHNTNKFCIYATCTSTNYYNSSDVGFSYTAGTALSYNNTSNPSTNVRIGYRDGVNFGNTVSAFRFANLTIPQGSTINTAIFTYTAYDTDASTDTVTVYAEDVDDAPAITTTGDEEPKDKGDRTTTASVNWTLPNQTIDSTYDSPEIKTVIQEIVDRASWSSGNALCLVIKNNGATENHNARNAPGFSWLYITYTAAASDLSASASSTSTLSDSITINKDPLDPNNPSVSSTSTLSDAVTANRTPLLPTVASTSTLSDAITSKSGDAIASASSTSTIADSVNPERIGDEVTNLDVVTASTSTPQDVLPPWYADGSTVSDSVTAEKTEVYPNNISIVSTSTLADVIMAVGGAGQVQAVSTSTIADAIITSTSGDNYAVTASISTLSDAITSKASADLVNTTSTSTIADQALVTSTADNYILTASTSSVSDTITAVGGGVIAQTSSISTVNDQAIVQTQSDNFISASDTSTLADEIIAVGGAGRANVVSVSTLADAITSQATGAIAQVTSTSTVTDQVTVNFDHYDIQVNSTSTATDSVSLTKAGAINIEITDGFGPFNCRGKKIIMVDGNLAMKVSGFYHISI